MGAAILRQLQLVTPPQPDPAPAAAAPGLPAAGPGAADALHRPANLHRMPVSQMAEHLERYLASMPDNCEALRSISYNRLGVAVGKLAACHGSQGLRGVPLGSTGMQVAKNLANHTLGKPLE